MTTKISKKSLQLLAICVLSSIGTTGNAADAELMTFEVPEYIVTATKTKLNSKQVPMTIEVLEQKDIQNLGAYNVQDALRLSLSLNVQDNVMSGNPNSMSGNQVQIRGMETRHTLILIDGKRVASENTGSTTNVYELNRINIADIERIEIIRGNGSTLYGSDALGGVINIVTKKYSKESGSINFHTGTQRNGTNFFYSSGKEGKISTKINGGIEKVRKQEDSYYSATAGGEATSSNMYGSRRYLHTTFAYDFDENRSLALDANFMREQFLADSSTPDNVGRYNFDNNRSDYALTYSNTDYRHDYSLRAYYSNYRKVNTDYENNQFTDFDNSVYKTMVFEGKDTWNWDKNNKLTFGAEYKENSMQGTRFGGGGDEKYEQTINGITKPGSQKSTDSYSIYLQDEINVGDKLLVIPALRYDRYASFGGEMTPKLGATYSFSDKCRIKMNYGKGFRAPTIYELYATMEKRMGFMNVIVDGNPNLEAEEAKNFDISIEGERGKASAKLTYFHNKVDNLIETKILSSGFEPSMGMVLRSTYVNIGKATIKGTEAEADYRFDKHWRAKVTHTYLDAKDSNNNIRLDNRAKQTGTVQLSYTNVKESPLVATLWTQYQVDYLYDGNAYTFATTNLVVNKAINKNFNIYVGIDNIFNKKLFRDDDHTYAIAERCWRMGTYLTF